MIDLRKKDDMIAAIEQILQQEALKGNQHKIDKNKNNKIDAEDFKLLRKEDNVDEALKGNQHKIDKNKNNKIDAEDFKMLRKEESVEEGIKDIAKKAFKALTGGSDEDQRKNLQRKMGLPQTGKKPEPQKEEVEQIDELSKSTLGSYIKKAAADSTISRKIGADFENRANSKRSPAMKDASTALSDKFKSDSRKRKANVDKAVDRLTKEEVQGKTLKQFKENAFDWKKKPEPQPSGGSGVKQGSRYGGSKQKDKPEQETDEKK